MIFGPSLHPAESSAPAHWLDAAVIGGPGTVGRLVPAGYEAVVRLHPPSPCRGWWSRYRELFVLVAQVGHAYTATPDRAWLAVWEGHGFDRGTTHLAWRDPPADDDERRRRALRRAEARTDDERRHAAVRAALEPIPRVERPDRVFYLMRGSVEAVGGFRYPDTDGWRNPDLVWPDDRAWFLATDVDMWSVFVAGSGALAADLERRAPVVAERVTLDERLPIED